MNIILDTEFDIEKNNRHTAKLVCIGMFEANLQVAGWTPDLAHEWAKHYVYFKEMDRNIFKGHTIIGHNLSSDVGLLRVNDYDFRGCHYWDTLTGLRNINENEEVNGLKPWATYLGLPPYWLDFERLLESGVKVSDMPVDLIRDYNAWDLVAQNKLFWWQYPKLKDHKIFHFEMSIFPLVERMETNGIGVDRNKIEESERDIDRSIQRIETEIYGEFGDRGIRNLNSHVQVSRLLYDIIGLRVGKHGRSTNERALNTLSHPIIDKLLERRGLFKLKTTYVNPTKAAISDGVIYGDVRIHGAESGRFARWNPPLQTYPVKIRNWFEPQYDEFCWWDLDQIEFKLIADVAEEKDLIEKIKRGMDVHEATARQMFGEFTKEGRRIAKTINYGKIYGAGVGRLAAEAGVTWNRAQEFSRIFDNEFRSLIKFIAWVHDEVRKTGRITSPFGRVRNFSLDRDIAEEYQIEAMQREAVDFMIQSMGHDISLILWREIDKELPYLHYVNELHDEVVSDVAQEEADAIQLILPICIDRIPELCYNEFRWELQVPITGTVSRGKEWS
jgi:DNA polymerase-1